MNRKLKDFSSDHLFEAILKLKTVDECYDFFEDLCTVSEFKALSQRFEVAYMLSKGAIYQERCFFEGKNFIYPDSYCYRKSFTK